MKMQVLSPEQIYKTMQLTQELLENVGIRVDDEEVRQVLEKRGARVDGDIVKFDKALLEELLSTVPKSYSVCGVAGDEFTIGDGKQKITGIVTDPLIIDYETGEPRLPGIDDVKNNTILNQRNDMVYAMSRMDFPVTEYTDATSTWRSLETHLLNHTKHYAIYAANYEDFMTWVDIAKMLAEYKGAEPGKLMSAAVPTLSPMALVDINCEILKQCTKLGCAVIPTTCPMAGTTSPYSIEGTMLQTNAEVISLAAVTQALSPGNPFLYASGPSVSDMRTGHDMYYTMDKMLWKIGLVELAKAYGIPSMTEMGGTLGYRYDMQSGAESMMFMQGAISSGADVISGIGSCINANGLSSEMIVIQGEWLKIAQFLAKGLSIERLERSYTSIAEQGPGGSFIMDDFTLEMLYADAFYKADLLDTAGGYEKSKSILEKAHGRVRELTQGYNSPVPGEVQEMIRRYFAGIYKRILG